MEKEILEITVNENLQDCIINYFMEAVKDENLKPVYTDRENGIAKVKGKAHEIILYVKDNNDYNKVSVVKLTAYGIKKLYAIIHKIEQKTGEEFIDDF